MSTKQPVYSDYRVIRVAIGIWVKQKRNYKIIPTKSNEIKKTITMLLIIGMEGFAGNYERTTYRDYDF